MGLRNEMRELRAAEPGRRFQEGHERTRVDRRVFRYALITLGVALMVTAAVTFWVPGPNFVLVLAGLALVGGQSETVAKLMDRGEVAGRRWHRTTWEPYPHKSRLKLVAASILLVAAAALGWVAYEQGWLPRWFPLVD